MKIKIDVSNNFTKIYDEARGVAMSKRRILQNKNAKSLTYSSFLIIFFVLLILSGYSFVHVHDFFYFKLGTFLIVLAVVIFVFTIFRFIWTYKCREKQNRTIIIDEKGITDVSSFKDIEILFKWNRIAGVVIKEYSVTILTKGSVYFFFDVKQKDKILKAIKKYNKDILIIQP